MGEEEEWVTCSAQCSQPGEFPVKMLHLSGGSSLPIQSIPLVYFHLAGCGLVCVFQMRSNNHWTPSEQDPPVFWGDEPPQALTSASLVYFSKWHVHCEKGKQTYLVQSGSFSSLVRFWLNLRPFSGCGLIQDSNRLEYVPETVDYCQMCCILIVFLHWCRFSTVVQQL